MKTGSHEHKEKEHHKEKSKTEDFDPLQNPPKHQEHKEEVSAPLYPSLHEVVKHVDEENVKAHPEKSKEEHQKKHKSLAKYYILPYQSQ